MLRRCVLLCLVFIALCAPLSAKKKKKKDLQDQSQEEQTDDEMSNAVAGDAGTAINLNVPQKPRGYFDSIDTAIVHKVEIGTPAAIREAMSILRGKEQTENVSVLMAVSDGIMRMVWKSEIVDWQPVATLANTPYTGAIASANGGIYDTSTGNKDFLTYVLPSLVVMNAKKESVAGYAAQAESALREGLALCPDSVLAQYLMALLYIKQGRDKDALPLLQKAYSVCNGKEIAFALANVYNTLGNKDEAFKLSTALIARWPSDMDVLALCAESAYAFKDYSAAESYVARLLQQEPNNTAFILFRAKILVAMGDYIRATSMLDIYARKDNTARDYLLLRARVQRDWSGNMTAALATCEDALKRYPKDVDVLLLAASIAASTNGVVGGKSAAELADAALALNPDSDEAIKYKIDALVEEGEWQKAYKESAWYLHKNIQTMDRDRIFTHINICLETRHGAEAWELIAPMYKENPADETVLRTYVAVLCRTGRTDMALALINKELGTANASMRSFYYYQRSLLQSSQEAALADLRSSLIALPRNKDALFRLYQIYYDNRDYRKAQYYLKQVIALDRGNAAMRRLDEELQRLVR